MLNDQLKWMYALERFGIKPGLEVMQNIMEVLGHPETKWPSVHITGTVGKGSTAALTACALQEAGYKVGLYTSPHLIRFNERIQINGQEISDEALADLIGEVRRTLEDYSIQATFFEFTTALAFLYFARQKVDIAVIEVGMGGRLDATNVIVPEVSVITRIGFDHEKFLGDTLLKIAQEKAGIIKRGVPVVTYEKKPDILHLLKTTAQQQSAQLYVVSEQLKTTFLEETLESERFQIGENIFTTPLLGRHQIENAATAYMALEVLRSKGWKISTEDMTQGFKHVRWPGRMQVISQKPLILVDGAHNPDGVAALSEFIKGWSRYDVLVLAQKQGKKLDDMHRLIVPLFKQVIVTEGTYEPMPAADLASTIKAYTNGNIVIIPNSQDALRKARERLPYDGTMLVTGSLYMIGAAL